MNNYIELKMKRTMVYEANAVDVTPLAVHGCPKGAHVQDAEVATEHVLRFGKALGELMLNERLV